MDALSGPVSVIEQAFLALPTSIVIDERVTCQSHGYRRCPLTQTRLGYEARLAQVALGGTT